jgi:tyrosinase
MLSPDTMLNATRNVDRLYAMYQARHPDRVFAPTNIGSNGNVWLEEGTTVDEKTLLLPFRKSSGSFWTTSDARNTTTLGYAYPETMKISGQSEEDYQDEVSKAIATLYGSSTRAMLTTNIATAGGAPLLTKDGAFTDWAIDTTALTSGLPPTFVVRFSLVGDFSSDDPVDVGTWTKLMPSSHGHGSNNKRASTSERPYQGRISLTANLIDCIAAGKLASLNSGDVVPYLKDKLTWKVFSVSLHRLT